MSVPESGDVPFGFPVTAGTGEEGVAKSDEQRLIQTGELTPFGSSVSTSADSAPPVGGVGSTSDSNVQTARSDVAADSAPAQNVPSMKLCSDSFDGLFSSSVSDTPGKRRIARIPKKKKNGSLDHQSGGAMSRSRSSSLEPKPETAGGMSSDPHAATSEPDRENALSDGDDWVPSLADLLDSDSPSGESDYLTDEELGGGVEAKKKKKKRLRPLSSDDDLSDEDGSPRGKRRRTAGWGASRHADDGDKNLYRERLR